MIDRASGRVYAVSNDGVLRTVALADGSDAAQPLQVVTGPATNKVWGGLNLVNGSLYIATASDGCDTPPWRGTVYRVSVAGGTPTLAGSWAVDQSIPPPNGGGGIWGYGGVSSDTANGRIFAATAADSNELYTPYSDFAVALDSSLGFLGAFEPFHPSSFPCNGQPCDECIIADWITTAVRQCPLQSLPHRPRRPIRILVAVEENWTSRAPRPRRLEAERIAQRWDRWHSTHSHASPQRPQESSS